jgi:hypothetical protein
MDATTGVVGRATTAAPSSPDQRKDRGGTLSRSTSPGSSSTRHSPPGSASPDSQAEKTGAEEPGRQSWDALKERVGSPAAKQEKSDVAQELFLAAAVASPTPAKQDVFELLPLRVESSPTIAPSEVSPSTSASSPSQEPIKIQPTPEITTGYGYLLSKEPAVDEASPSVLSLSSALAEPQIILQLASAIQEPDLGSKDLPTVGSLGHKTRTCKPCAFLHTKGCENGVNCPFCHLCNPGEKKRRLKEKKDQRMQVTRYIQLQEQISQEWQMYIPPPR